LPGDIAAPKGVKNRFSESLTLMKAAEAGRPVSVQLIEDPLACLPRQA
jgi:hypothetical protein